ncbi:nuclear transport factor 2 family protein [Angustibacter luteus]|uniref:Nuclear transport factor 2 family protein n=1 Tax=Angustibacter luteus TaxID=658456 RepID=A0ABW1JDM9_9ACTN
MAGPDNDAERACERLIIQFAHYLDHRRFTEVAALFAEDGVWLRHGEQLVGPQAIRSLLEQRSATQVERHVMTTVLVEQASPTECTAVSYVLIFRAHGPDPHGQLPKVGEFHDRFSLTPHGWRFAFRTSLPAFAGDSQ